jgi:bZIP Maf transcription factor
MALGRKEYKRLLLEMEEGEEKEELKRRRRRLQNKMCVQ